MVYDSAASKREVSICCPSPVRMRESNAARMAWLAYSPALRSLIGTPTLAGSSGRPVTDNTPLIACATRSKPPRSRYGPVCPKPEIEQYTSAGYLACTSSNPKPSRVIVPGRKFSTSTSAVSMKRHSTCFPGDVRISTATPYQGFWPPTDPEEIDMDAEVRYRGLWIIGTGATRSQ